MCTQTVSQDKCLSPRGLGAKSPLVWEQFKPRSLLSRLRVSWFRPETPRIRTAESSRKAGRGSNRPGRHRPKVFISAPRPGEYGPFAYSPSKIHRKAWNPKAGASRGKHWVFQTQLYLLVSVRATVPHHPPRLGCTGECGRDNAMCSKHSISIFCFPESLGRLMT